MAHKQAASSQSANMGIQQKY